MESRVVKIVLYVAGWAVIVYWLASIFGRRGLLQPPKPKQCSRKDKAMGSVWARKSVPAPPSSVAPVVAPGGFGSPAYGPAPGTFQ